jgi:hypothetical protein
MRDWKIPVFSIIGGVHAVRSISYDDVKINETLDKLYHAYNSFIYSSGKLPTAVIMNYLDYENIALYTSRLDQTLEMPTEFQGCTILVSDNEKLLPEFFLLDAHEQYKKILTEKYSR